MVPHADLCVLDPIWTTTNISSYHGLMMYDTLFGIDANLKPQPQMVAKTDVSANRKTYTFALRPGLKWHHGTPVTARDCVASLRRWQVKDGAGQHLFIPVADTSVVDDRSFRIALKEAKRGCGGGTRRGLLPAHQRDFGPDRTMNNSDVYKRLDNSQVIDPSQKPDHVTDTRRRRPLPGHWQLRDRNVPAVAHSAAPEPVVPGQFRLLCKQFGAST